MSHEYLISSIIVAAGLTYLTRVIPFIFFGKKEPSSMIKYIELNMPVMIMVILIFYALKDVQWGTSPFGMPEIVGVVVAIMIHVKFGNALLSIFKFLRISCEKTAES